MPVFQAFKFASFKMIPQIRSAESTTAKLSSALRMARQRAESPSRACTWRNNDCPVHSDSGITCAAPRSAKILAFFSW